jgi:hypothetical protein
MSGPVLCVVGAGTAGLESLLSARAQLGPAAELRLIAPNRDFRYRPISRDSPLRPARERSIAVVVPRGARWPLPAYDLALVIAWSSSAADPRVTLITAEDRPLGALGPAAADAVMRELDQAGVETVAGVEALDDSAQASSAAPPPLMLVRERPGIAEDAPVGRPSDPARVHMGAGVVRRDTFANTVTAPGSRWRVHAARMFSSISG